MYASVHIYYCIAKKKIYWTIHFVQPSYDYEIFGHNMVKITIDSMKPLKFA